MLFRSNPPQRPLPLRFRRKIQALLRQRRTPGIAPSRLTHPATLKTTGSMALNFHRRSRTLPAACYPPMITVMSLKSISAVLTLSLGVTALISAQQGQQEKVDLNVIHKIKVAEFGAGGGIGGGGGGRGRGGAGSKVMDTVWSLTDRYGPRLTNSPQFRAAGDWAVGQLKEWGLSNVHLEKWPTAEVTSGPIPGWQIKAYSGAMVEPSYMSLDGMKRKTDVAAYIAEIDEIDRTGNDPFRLE